MSSDEESCTRIREKFTCEKPVKEDEICNNLYDSNNDADSYGPALPPHLLPDRKSQELNNEMFGPQLPNNYRQNTQSKEVYGPHMPNATNGVKVIGPEIPAHLLPKSDFNDEEEDVDEKEDDNSEDDPGYGPSLALMSDGTTRTDSIPIYKSSQKGSSETVTKRESWMLELPPERAESFGLGPRQFRTRHPNEKDSDRSGWTETPMDRKKGIGESERVSKSDDKIIIQKQIEEKNEEMERLVRKVAKKKKREEESLLEIHRKMRKKEMKEAKKREKEGKTTERRPFDRNTDLQIQKFDLAQKNAVIRKAALLNDRFAQGESKFL